jgi:hypothetical protein
MCVCKGCGKQKINKLKDVKDQDNYYCKNCLPLRLATQKKNGKRKQDWSTIRKLNAIAMAHGYESLFKVRGEYKIERTQGTNPML